MESTPVSLADRTKARVFREQLTRGYSSHSTFYKLVYRIADDVLIQSHDEFVKEKTEHGALIREYRNRQSEPESQLNKLFHKAVQASS